MKKKPCPKSFYLWKLSLRKRGVSSIGFLRKKRTNSYFLHKIQYSGHIYICFLRILAWKTRIWPLKNSYSTPEKNFLRKIDFWPIIRLPLWQQLLPFSNILTQKATKQQFCQKGNNFLFFYIIKKLIFIKKLIIF